MKHAPISCALALSAAVTGCATPKMGAPNLDTCMAPETTKYLMFLETTKTKLDSTCTSAAFVRTIATLTDSRGNQDPAAAAVAIRIYAQMSEKEQKLADAMLAERNLTIDGLKQIADESKGCRSEEDSKGKIRISCPAPFRAYNP